MSLDGILPVQRQNQQCIPRSGPIALRFQFTPGPKGQVPHNFGTDRTPREKTRAKA